MSPHHAMPLQLVAPRGRGRGFTLVELMIVVTIVAVLALVAMPAYQRYVTKSRRADAINALSAIVQAQERWRSNNSSYASTLELLGIDDKSPGGHYTLSLSGLGSPPSFISGFEVHAVPVSSGQQAQDSECSDMFIRLQGGNMKYLDTNSASTTANAACWPQ